MLGETPTGVFGYQSLFGVLFTVLLVVFVHDVKGALPRHGERIIGGQGVSNRLYPFMVSIQKRSKRLGKEHWKHSCGGSIVNPTWILTACHCVALDKVAMREYHDPAKYRVVAGITNYNSEQVGRQEVPVLSFVAHPQCIRQGKPLHTYYDAGLIQLLSPLQYTSRVQPLKLFTTQPVVAAKEQSRLQGEHAHCFSPGWGRVDETPSVTHSPFLRHANQTLHTAAECHKMLCKGKSHRRDGNCADFDEIDQICVTSGDGNVCKGDSGSPLVCNGFVFGVVSQGGKCKIASKEIFTGIRTIVNLVNAFVPPALSYV